MELTIVSSLDNFSMKKMIVVKDDLIQYIQCIWILDVIDNKVSIVVKLGSSESHLK